jgi:hypothetical protein
LLWKERQYTSEWLQNLPCHWFHTVRCQSFCTVTTSLSMCAACEAYWIPWVKSDWTSGSTLTRHSCFLSARSWKIWCSLLYGFGCQVALLSPWFADLTSISYRDQTRFA